MLQLDTKIFFCATIGGCITRTKPPTRLFSSPHPSWWRRRLSTTTASRKEEYTESRWRFSPPSCAFAPCHALLCGVYQFMGDALYRSFARGKQEEKWEGGIPRGKETYAGSSQIPFPRRFCSVQFVTAPYITLLVEFRVF